MDPRAHSSEVASFYHLESASLAGAHCSGLACFLARAGSADAFAAAACEGPRVHCLGKCYAAPATSATRARPSARIASPQAVVLERVADGGARTFADYVARGGYRALERAAREPPERVIEAIARSGLRGRGGAGFPTGAKLHAVARQASPRYVVANADEGDPGAFIDRFLLEDDPHAVLEGLALAAYATGATKAFVYLRCEYPEARVVLERAIADATGEGVFGPSTTGSRPPVDIELVVGKGSYVCGEETALLESIEGRRPFVRSRPPYPSAVGLFGRPTLVQNVETLVSFPWIVAHGGEAYAAMGLGTSRGTKVLSLSSLFRNPGLVEIELGTTMRTVIEDHGGGLVQGSPWGVILGGPLAGILPPACFDAPIAFDELCALGATVGHGGLVALDARTTVRELLRHVFDFGAFESCGKCTPCRIGSASIAASMAGSPSEGARFDEGDFESTVEALRRTSLCGHGAGLGELARSVLRYYREELRACFA